MTSVASGKVGRLAPAKSSGTAKKRRMCVVGEPFLKNVVVRFKITDAGDLEKLRRLSDVDFGFRSLTTGKLRGPKRSRALMPPVGQRKRHHRVQQGGSNFFILNPSRKRKRGSGRRKGAETRKRRREEEKLAAETPEFVLNKDLLVRWLEDCDDRLTFSFSVFPSTGTVTATGIQRHEDDAFRHVLTQFARLTDIDPTRLSPEKTDLKVVNSTYSGELVCSALGEAEDARRVSFSEKLHRASSLPRVRADVDVSFRSQFFPAAKLNFSGVKGTAHVFNNGKYVLVGVVSPAHARDLTGRLCAVMNACSITSTRANPCAWSAA